MWVRRATSAPGELASPQPGVARYMPAPRHLGPLYPTQEVGKYS